MRAMKSKVSHMFTCMFCIKVTLEVEGIIIIIRRLGVVIRKVDRRWFQGIFSEKERWLEVINDGNITLNNSH